MADINLNTSINRGNNTSAMRVTLTESVDFRVDSEVMKGADGASWDLNAQEILDALKEANPNIPAASWDNGRIPAGTTLNIPEIDGLTRAEWFETDLARPILGMFGTRNGGRLFGDARLEGEEGVDYRTVSTEDITGPELLTLISRTYASSRSDAIAAYNGIGIETLEGILNGDTDITAAGSTIRIPLNDPFTGRQIDYQGRAMPAAAGEAASAPLEARVNQRDVAEAPTENFQQLVNASRNYYQARSQYTAMRNELDPADRSRMTTQVSAVVNSLRGNDFDVSTIPDFDPTGYANPDAARASYEHYMSNVVPREVELLAAGADAGLNPMQSRAVANNLRSKANLNTDNSELTRSTLIQALDATQTRLGRDNREAVSDALEASISSATPPSPATGAATGAAATGAAAGAAAGGAGTTATPAANDDELIAFISAGNFASSGVHLHGGLSNDAVARIQQTLLSGGHYGEGAEASEVDGKFGGRTREAVQALQTIYGLTVDGIADGIIGPDTLAALQIEEAQLALGAGGDRAALIAELQDIQALGTNIPAAVRDEVRGLLTNVEAADLGADAEAAAPIIAAIQANVGPERQ